MRTVSDLVPKREVEVNPEHQLPCHYPRYDCQPRIIGRCNEELQDIDVAHHGQKDEECEEHIIGHRGGIGTASSFLPFLLLSKDKGVIGIAEGLREEHHHDGQLVASSIDSQLAIGVMRIIKE